MIYEKASILRDIFIKELNIGLSSGKKDNLRLLCYLVVENIRDIVWFFLFL